MKKPHFVSKMRLFKAFSGFYGGDKRDRTADLLNAMDCPRAVGVLRAAHREKLLISNAFSVSRGSNTVELCCFCVLDWLFLLYIVVGGFASPATTFLFYSSSIMPTNL